MSYSLNDNDSYYLELNTPQKDILKNYMQEVHNYTLAMTKNKEYKTTYYKYIFVKGIEVISHIFMIILYYTKNVKVSSYYIENITSQYSDLLGHLLKPSIANTNFSCKEASLLLLKNSIYKIMLDKQKQTIYTEIESKILNDVRYFVDIFNSVLYEIIESNPHQFTGKIMKFISNMSNLHFMDVDLIYVLSLINENKLDYEKSIKLCDILKVNNWITKNDIDKNVDFNYLCCPQP